MKEELDILIIDNDPIFQLVTKKLLSKSDYPFSVSSYMNGLEALQAFLNNKASNNKKMLLLDLDMPLMTGWDFLDAYYENGLEKNNNNCVYIITSSIAPEDKSKAKSYSVVHGYFEKPLNFDAINQVIHCCLKN